MSGVNVIRSNGDYDSVDRLGRKRGPGRLCPGPLVCLRPGFEHHVEGAFGGAAHAAKARALQHLGQLGFAGLRAPSASPTSCASEVGTQIMVDAL